MLNQIKKIQQRPESSRKKIAFIISAIITLIIIFVWISVFSSRFGQDEKNISNVDPSTGKTKLEIASPFESIKDDLSTIFGNIGEKFGELKNKLK